MTEYTTEHVADRLMRAVECAGVPICVGIDPVLERLPSDFLTVAGADAIATFSCGVIDAVGEVAACVKIQSACFERYGPEGMAALDRVITHAIVAAEDGHRFVILDAKRGDIGISAEHYAAAIFDRDPASAPDMVTINGYLGDDGIRPFLRPGRGVFVLVRTSNPGGDALQTRRLASGETLAEALADLVARIGDDHLGGCGYSAVGAVVGATKSAEIASLRARMPRQILLVPGYGAQGATGSDIAHCFNKDGRGAIISASRSIMYAFEQHPGNWRTAIRDAAMRFAEEVSIAIAASLAQ